MLRASGSSGAAVVWEVPKATGKDGIHPKFYGEFWSVALLPCQQLGQTLPVKQGLVLPGNDVDQGNAGDTAGA